MDKVVKILFSLSLFVVSCSMKTDYDENTNNMKFVIEKYVTIDFKNEKLFLDYYGLKYEDTIIFTKSEKKEIIVFFNEINLNNKKGEFWYIDENSTTASLHDEIFVLVKRKIKSRYIINSYHDINSNFFEDEKAKTIKFRNLIKQIIINKNSYKKAEDSLKKIIKRDPHWLM